MDYLAWNDIIASHVFRSEMAERSVYLYITDKLIAELGQSRGVDFQDFIEAVKTGPPWVTRQGLCMKALQSYTEWRQRGLYYPPYIGYLALFVLAGGIEGDFATHSYYPRLRTLLDEEPTTGQYPSFHRMWEIWEDLEKWSNEDKDGELGIFNTNSVGNRNHIGLPLAQTLLTEEERHALPTIFATADLEPTSLPSEQAIAFLLAKRGHKHLRKRTLRLLEETSDSNELCQALLERIIDELRGWDGTAELPSANGSQIHGLLRLCCKLDPIAGRASLTLRCSTKQEFPEDDLLLFLEGNSKSFSCYEQGMGWSSPLISESDGKPLDASQFDWLKGLRMQSADSRWCFKLPAYPIRVFVNSQELSTFVEVRQIPAQKPFYLAAHEDCWELLKKWGNSSCQAFETLPILDGLPSKWLFFKAAAAYSDELIKREYPILAFPTAVRLELLRGIRLDRGNKFFKFAPPKVLLQGGDESIKVYCNEKLLDGTETAGIYELPKDIPAETKLVIEAQIGEGTFKRHSLYLVEKFPWQFQIHTKQFDSFGNRQMNVDNQNEGDDGVAGALVTGVNFPPFNFNTFLPIQGKQRIFFVGKEPGQVVIWPLESLPTDWMPVWAVSKGRHRGQVMFCGSNLAESQPSISKCRDRKKIRLWKEILWIDRKKISPPTQPNLRALWKKFQKEAEHVK